jgi:hypothetical protein
MVGHILRTISSCGLIQIGQQSSVPTATPRTTSKPDTEIDARMWPSSKNTRVGAEMVATEETASEIPAESARAGRTAALELDIVTSE